MLHRKGRVLPLTIFLGAFLLFQVQPIVGRYVLPWFGGGPMVWTSCMLFFQALLVGGYAYAHWLGSLRGRRAQSSLHIALLAASLLFLPLDPRGILARQASSSAPSERILLALTIAIAGPYFILSATGPLLQRWFHLRAPNRSPWRLYAVSNVASFLALLSYPFGVEPYLTLRAQSWIWSALYVAFVLACMWVAWTLRRAPLASGEEAERPASQRPAVWQILFWIGLAATGSILLLATTNLICQDIAVIPFLWIAPLAVYLLTFVLVFASDRYRPRGFYAAAAGLLVPSACGIMIAAVGVPAVWQLGVYLAALFVTCMVVHGELASARPGPEWLTLFYLAIAGGGAIGGVFVALISPSVFSDYSEYPIGLAAACLLAFLGWARTGAMRQWTSRNLAVRIPLMALLFGGMTALVTTATSNKGAAVSRYRNFYGILRVSEGRDPLNRPFRELTHGRIRHGFQYLEAPQSAWPTTYYGPHSGAGVVLNSLAGGGRRVAVIGLGAGTLAAWGRPGDTFRFYEINPDVVTVARAWFTYLKDSKARIEIVVGDARVELERELFHGGAPQFDVIAVDAFSSDAIPLHLLTSECSDLYRRRLAPGGALLFHISNRLLQLDPVTRGVAAHLGWQAAPFYSPADAETGESQSSWVLVTANSDLFERPQVAGAISRWRDGSVAPLMWSDDFASLWHVLKI